LANKIKSITTKERASDAAARLEDNRRQGLNINTKGELQGKATTVKKRRRPIEEEEEEEEEPEEDEENEAEYEDDSDDDPGPSPTSHPAKRQKSVRKDKQDKTFRLEPRNTTAAPEDEEEDLLIEDEAVNEAIDPNANVFIIGGNANAPRQTRSGLRPSTRSQTRQPSITRPLVERNQLRHTAATKQTTTQKSKAKKKNDDGKQSRQATTRNQHCTAQKRHIRPATPSQAVFNVATPPATTEEEDSSSGVEDRDGRQEGTNKRRRLAYRDSSEVDLEVQQATPDEQSEYARVVWSSLEDVRPDDDDEDFFNRLNEDGVAGTRS
jgi:hypothetical protein